MMYVLNVILINNNTVNINLYLHFFYMIYKKLFKYKTYIQIWRL
jgi:hypothetical protein